MKKWEFFIWHGLALLAAALWVFCFLPWQQGKWMVYAALGVCGLIGAVLGGFGERSMKTIGASVLLPLDISVAVVYLPQCPWVTLSVLAVAIAAGAVIGFLQVRRFLEIRVMQSMKGFVIGKAILRAMTVTILIAALLPVGHTIKVVAHEIKAAPAQEVWETEDVTEGLEYYI